ncbi:MAG: MBL fold metallo-hydrolase [Salibacteraceae bacterium]|nr:MBL fold metallo-hydrolase [Salibacteraceae bacterium]
MRLVFSLIVVLMFLSCGRKETTQQKVIENVDVQESKLGVYLQILGTTQDGGSPHTGCQKECCRVLFLAGKSDRKVVSLGLVSTETNQTWLFEATPDLPFQMQVLQKEIGSTSKTPNGIFLTHAHIGHYTGLMFLGREVMNSKNVSVYVLPRMKSFIESNGPWSQLVDLKNIELKQLKSDSVIQLNAKIRITPISIPHRDEFSETAGFLISGPSKTALFIPDIDKWKKWNRNINEFIAKVDYAFLDATFYDETEIPGRKMSEIPHPFVKESMQRFDTLSEALKKKIIFIHMNHTNPLLDRTSIQYQLVIKNGYHIAKNGDRYFL